MAKRMGEGVAFIYAEAHTLASRQMRKLDVGAAETASWCLASLRAALDEGRLDGSASYATITLRRHVEERLDRNERQIAAGPSRLATCYAQLTAELNALLALVARIEDAITQIIANDGRPGELEGMVLGRLVDTLDERLTRAHEAELDASMREHWTDIGGSG